MARNLGSERFRAQRLGVRIIASCAMVVAASCASEATVPESDQSPLVPAELQQLFLFYFSASGGSPAPHGFLVKRPGAEPLALTAYHVAGTAAGGAWLRSPVDPSVMIELGERVQIEGAATISAGGSQNDLAAFRVVNWNPALALELASHLPAIGDTVWVLAVHISDPANPHPRGGPRRHPARVDVSNASALVYTYLESANANYTSGAAVLDRDGRVVGVNVGTRVTSADEVAGLAVHVQSIRRMIGD